MEIKECLACDDYPVRLLFVVLGSIEYEVLVVKVGRTYPEVMMLMDGHCWEECGLSRMGFW
jgi:hypothetical protein